MFAEVAGHALACRDICPEPFRHMFKMAMHLRIQTNRLFKADEKQRTDSELYANLRGGLAI